MTNYQWQNNQLLQQNVTSKMPGKGSANSARAVYQTRQSSIESIIRQVNNTTVQSKRAKKSAYYSITGNRAANSKTLTPKPFGKDARLSAIHAPLEKDIQDKKSKVKFREGTAPPRNETGGPVMYELFPDAVLIISHVDAP